MAVMLLLLLLAAPGINNLNYGVFAEPSQRSADLDINSSSMPAFITPGQTYRIAIGASVVLPCRVTSAGNYVLVWKKGIAVLTAGPTKVTPSSRIRLHRGSAPSISPAMAANGASSSEAYNLEITSVDLLDAGNYVCQIGTLEPKEITHTLEILVPPQIFNVTPEYPKGIVQGANVILECKANGNPVPTIAWTRKNDVLPNGERTSFGGKLLIQNVDRRSAGQYQCEANNGVGQADTSLVNLVILYPPEVETERPIVHAGVGMEVQLVCIVHAEPPPTVVWYKDTQQLGTTEQHTTQSRGNRHTLVIRNVTRLDFGNYSCGVSNTQGKARSHLTLSGTAAPGVFDSPPLSPAKDAYNVSWYVLSHAPVTEFRLYFRQQPAAARQSHASRHEVDFNVIHKDTSNGSFMSYRNEWNSVVLPVMQGTQQQQQQLLHNEALRPFIRGDHKRRMAYFIHGLASGAHYEARVQAKNEHGWNKLSPVFHFATRSNEPEVFVEPSPQPAVYSDKNRGDLSMGAFSTATIHKTAIVVLSSLILTTKMA